MEIEVDGKKKRVEIRGLKEDEIERWLDFVAGVFKDVGRRPPRQYFANHLYLDPWKDLNGIRVALVDGAIVSTVRVFRRKCYLRGKVVDVGGIGEVSTDPSMRSKGLARAVLHDAIKYLAHKHVGLVSLHTGAAAPFYAREGFRAVPRQFVMTRLAAAAPPPAHPLELVARKMDFADRALLDGVRSIHASYSRRFNGPFVRDSDGYWQQWVPVESPHAYVAVDAANHPVAFLSVRLERPPGGGVPPSPGGSPRVLPAPTATSVKEFTCSDAELRRDGGRGAFAALLAFACRDCGTEALPLRLPAHVPHGDAGAAVEEERGTMYRVTAPELAGALGFEILDEEGKVFVAEQDYGEWLHLLFTHQNPRVSQGILLPALRSYHVFFETDGY
eukprot:tig00000737_g3808.t1